MARKKLGKYEIIDRIGRGGMAEVYRGYHVSLDRYVAIKLLHPFLADDPEFKDRFENEARNVAKLKHPNIVQVYDFEYDEGGDSYYMVMELINGPTLKDKLFDLSTSGERFAIAETIRIIKSAADALAYAHQRNMIHRDVKPANLMLDEDQRMVLTDFGIAKIVTGAQFTASGGMVGTPAYMSPEQGLGEAGDERSDLYSLGAILYQMVTGRLPFDADTPLAVILKHVNEPVPSPRAVAPDTPEDLEAIICKALAKEPGDRYQTADGLVHDLNQLDETGQRRPFYSPTPPSIDRETRPAPPTPEQRALFAAAAETPPLAPAPIPAGVAAGLSKSPAPSSIPGAPARLHPGGVLGLAVGIVVIVALILLLFGGDDGPFAGLIAAENDTATPQPTVTALAALPGTTETPTTAPDAIPTGISPQATTERQPTEAIQEPTQTVPTTIPLPTDTPTLTPSLTPTLTDTPTLTPSPTVTITPSPDVTGTALVHFYETEAAASPTPNITQTLSACDFEYIVITPTTYPAPPTARDFNDPRLVPTGNNFEFEIVLRNVGTCEWPENVRITFNPELTANPDSSVNLEPVRAACEDVPLRPGMNFALQQQPNFFLREPVGVTTESAPLIFTGTAPNTFGCYYGVWDLLYPNSDLPIGRPLVLAIRVWTG
ncbi:MAG: protein kinase [Anaerolineae bacterium]|nr:protein kinase [Anaerolineae bacterium]